MSSLAVSRRILLYSGWLFAKMPFLSNSAAFGIAFGRFGHRLLAALTGTKNIILKAAGLLLLLVIGGRQTCAKKAPLIGP